MNAPAKSLLFNRDSNIVATIGAISRWHAEEAAGIMVDPFLHERRR